MAAPPILHVRDIPDDGLALQCQLEARWLADVLAGTGCAPAGDPAGVLDVRVDKRGRDVGLTGNVRARVRAECGRCLAPVELEVRADFALNLEPRPTARPSGHGAGRRDEVELSAPDLDVDFYDDDRVDLGQWAREQVLLEVPAHPQCPQGCVAPTPATPPPDRDAAGIDPRLAPLQRFGKKE